MALSDDYLSRDKHTHTNTTNRCFRCPKCFVRWCVDCRCCCCWMRHGRSRDASARQHHPTTVCSVCAYRRELEYSCSVQLMSFRMPTVCIFSAMRAVRWRRPRPHGQGERRRGTSREMVSSHTNDMHRYIYAWKAFLKIHCVQTMFA